MCNVSPRMCELCKSGEGFVISFYYLEGSTKRAITGNGGI